MHENKSIMFSCRNPIDFRHICYFDPRASDCNLLRTFSFASEVATTSSPKSFHHPTHFGSFASIQHADTKFLNNYASQS